MKISYNWLKQYLHLDLPVEKVSDYLTNIGLEVEGVDYVEMVKGGLEGVVIGEVIKKTKHPNADRLNLTTVSIGSEDDLQIVCGAPNVDVGQKVPVATVGTFLYSQNEKFKIKRSKIRGEISVGMICSEKELGLGTDDDGIMVLDSDAEVGSTAANYFDLDTDIVFNIGLTPNRSDAMSHIGVARDLKCFLNFQGNNLKLCIPSIDEFDSLNMQNNILDIKIENKELCPRYSAISISGVKVEDSPVWLQRKLKAIGLVPINNIVDVTNYVLHEIGHPLHAFDFSKIDSKEIVVKTLNKKTSFITLDKNEISISEEDLMICDSSKRLCIAGVFGGLESGVDAETTDILLESAYFHPTHVRRTAKRHVLSTDASFRFERGCDPNITIYALKRAALLINELAGGNISSDIFDYYPVKIEPVKINLFYANINNLVGEVIDKKVVKVILEGLDIIIASEEKDFLVLHVPTYRFDVKREVDVIEEILRIYGFNNVKLPSKLTSTLPTFLKNLDLKNLVANFLSSNGFNEIMNNSLINVRHNSSIPEIKSSEDINILNPLSEEVNVMRQSMLFGGLQNIAYNQNRNNKNLKLYEFGKTYHREKEVNIEKEHLLLLMTGRDKFENWNTDDSMVDFYSLKEKVACILYLLGIDEYEICNNDNSGRSFGLDYNINGDNLVRFGKLHGSLCSSFNVKGNIFSADFNWVLLEKNYYKNIKYKSLNKFPEVRRDLSLLIDKDVDFSVLSSLVANTKIDILKDINLFDVYKGDKLPANKKSYSMSFVFADQSRTLTDFEIDECMDTLMSKFKEIGASFR